MTTITYDGGPAIHPMLALIESYGVTSEARTVSHSILDGPPVHTLRPAGPDAGTLTLLFIDETPARDCYSAHKLAAVFAIADTTRALLNFRYVVAGELRMQLDSATRERWLVTIPFQAVI